MPRHQAHYTSITSVTGSHLFCNGIHGFHPRWERFPFWAIRHARVSASAPRSSCGNVLEVTGMKLRSSHRSWMDVDNRAHAVVQIRLQFPHTIALPPCYCTQMNRSILHPVTIFLVALVTSSCLALLALIMPYMQQFPHSSSTTCQLMNELEFEKNAVTRHMTLLNVLISGLSLCIVNFD